MDYGEESAPRQSSNARQVQESVSRSQTRSAYTQEQSTLKKQKIRAPDDNRMQRSQDDYGEEAYGEEDMGEDYSPSRPTNGRQDMGQSEYGDEGEGESLSQSRYKPNGGLEMRLE